MFCQVLLIHLFESDYECICIVNYGNISNAPLNILSSVYCNTDLYNIDVFQAKALKTLVHTPYNSFSPEIKHF